MDVDPYELLVRWHLRFNGYLGVENFVVQQTVPGGNVQVGETDVLGVRFPPLTRGSGVYTPDLRVQAILKLLEKAAERAGANSANV